MISTRWVWISLSFLALACAGDDSSDEGGEATGTASESTGGGSASESGSATTTETSGGTTASSASGGGSSGGAETGVATTGGGFACGSDLACDPASEYCEVIPSNTGGRDTYSCQALPDACVEDVSCDCIIEAECPPAGGGVCNDDNGGFEVTCAHG